MINDCSEEYKNAQELKTFGFFASLRMTKKCVYTTSVNVYMILK